MRWFRSKREEHEYRRQQAIRRRKYRVDRFGTSMSRVGRVLAQGGGVLLLTQGEESSRCVPGRFGYEILNHFSPVGKWGGVLIPPVVQNTTLLQAASYAVAGVSYAEKKGDDAVGAGVTLTGALLPTDRTEITFSANIANNSDLYRAWFKDNDTRFVFGENGTPLDVRIIGHACSNGAELKLKGWLEAEVGSTAIDFNGSEAVFSTYIQANNPSSVVDVGAHLDAGTTDETSECAVHYGAMVSNTQQGGLFLGQLAYQGNSSAKTKSGAGYTSQQILIDFINAVKNALPITAVVVRRQFGTEECVIGGPTDPATFKTDQQAIIDDWAAVETSVGIPIYNYLIQAPEPNPTNYDVDAFLSYELVHQELAAENDRTSFFSLYSAYGGYGSNSGLVGKSWMEANGTDPSVTGSAEFLGTEWNIIREAGRL